MNIEEAVKTISENVEQLTPSQKIQLVGLIQTSVDNWHYDREKALLELFQTDIKMYAKVRDRMEEKGLMGLGNFY